MQICPGVTAGGQTTCSGTQAFCGFTLFKGPGYSSDGVAWEFTAQVVCASNLMNVPVQISCSGEPSHSYMTEIIHARNCAPFGNGQGVVAATLQDGDQLPPVDQCLATPFQSIPERVGLAATNWAIFAERGINIFLP